MIDDAASVPVPADPMDSAAGPALADAQDVLRRIRADEHDAREERDRLNSGGIARVSGGRPTGVTLREGEELVDARPAARVEPVGDEQPASTGRLLLTTQRLILVGQQPLEIDIRAIDEISLVGERLLLALRGNHGLCIDVSAPRVFRVRLAHAIAVRRSAAAEALARGGLEDQAAMAPILAVEPSAS